MPYHLIQYDLSRLRCCPTFDVRLSAFLFSALIRELLFIRQFERGKLPTASGRRILAFSIFHLYISFKSREELLFLDTNSDINIYFIDSTVSIEWRR